MNSDEKYAKLLALTVLYEKGEPDRTMQAQRITCRPGDVDVLLREITDKGFKDWVSSVARLFKTQ